MIKKWLKRLGKLLLVVALLLTVAWWFENWRGARAWEEAQERAKEAGLSLDLADYQPPPVPDEENLLKNPIFLKEWNGEIEPKLRSWTSIGLPNVKDYIQAYSKPTSGESVDHREYFEEELTTDEANERLDQISQGIQARLDQLSGILLTYPAHNLGRVNHNLEIDSTPSAQVDSLQNLANCLKSQAILALHLGRPDTALRNINCLIRMEEAFCRGSFLSGLLRSVLQGVTDTIIWEGILLHAWSPEHLHMIARSLDQRDHFDDFENVLKIETLYSVQGVDHLEEIQKSTNDVLEEITGRESTPTLRERFLFHLKTGGPSGWDDQRKAIIVDNGLRLLDEFQNEELKERPGGINHDYDVEQNYDPFQYAREQETGMRRFVTFLLKHETETRIAQIAVAAEQFYLKHSHYPDSLEAMNCDFETADALDPKGRTLSYQLDENGRPQIWSQVDRTIRWQFSPEEKKQKPRKGKRGR
ncbi:MAG: hypothetical protein ACON4R_13705 [Akkermansiaceae bacterium]